VDDAYTDQDVELAAVALARLAWPRLVATMQLSRSYRDQARAVLDALTAAGWHKPPEAEGG
jgi:hypothetical protein